MTALTLPVEVFPVIVIMVVPLTANAQSSALVSKFTVSLPGATGFVPVAASMVSAAVVPGNTPSNCAVNPPEGRSEHCDCAGSTLSIPVAPPLKTICAVSATGVCAGGWVVPAALVAVGEGAVDALPHAVIVTANATPASHLSRDPFTLHPQIGLLGRDYAARHPVSRLALTPK